MGKSKFEFDFFREHVDKALPGGWDAVHVDRPRNIEDDPNLPADQRRIVEAVKAERKDEAFRLLLLAQERIFRLDRKLCEARAAEVAAFRRALEIVAAAKEVGNWEHAETYLRVCLYEAKRDHP